MQFRIMIHTGAAAFEPEPAPELARILRSIADRLDRGEDFSMFRTLYDVNGNDCGRVALKDEAYFA